MVHGGWLLVKRESEGATMTKALSLRVERQNDGDTLTSRNKQMFEEDGGRFCCRYLS